MDVEGLTQEEESAAAMPGNVKDKVQHVKEKKRATESSSTLYLTLVMMRYLKRIMEMRRGQTREKRRRCERCWFRTYTYLLQQRQRDSMAGSWIMARRGDLKQLSLKGPEGMGGNSSSSTLLGVEGRLC